VTLRTEFYDLPAEVRLLIYRYVFKNEIDICGSDIALPEPLSLETDEDWKHAPDFPPSVIDYSLFHGSKDITRESYAEFFKFYSPVAFNIVHDLINGMHTLLPGRYALILLGVTH